MTKSNFNNFVALTVAIASVEQKTSKENKPYTVAHGSVPMDNGKDPMPIRIIATNGIGPKVKIGTSVMTGKLGYEEDKQGNGMPSLFPGKIEFPKEGNARRYAAFTLRAGLDGKLLASAKTAAFWATCRMALYCGKNKYGSYKPSLWFTVKGFTGKNGDESIPNAVADVTKGNLVNISGHLDYEIYQDKQVFSLIANKLEPFEASISSDQDEVPA